MRFLIGTQRTALIYCHCVVRSRMIKQWRSDQRDQGVSFFSISVAVSWWDLDEALWLCLIYYYYCFQRDLHNCGFCFSFCRSSWQTGRTDWLGEKYTRMCIHVCKCKQCVIWLHNICYLRLVYTQKEKSYHMELPGSMWILLQHSCTYA